MKPRFILSDYCTVRISLYSVWMRENADQNNSDYGHFLRSVVLYKMLIKPDFNSM